VPPLWAGPTTEWARGARTGPDRSCALVYCAGEVEIVPPNDAQTVSREVAALTGVAVVLANSLLPWRRASHSRIGRGVVDGALHDAWERGGRYVVPPDARREWSKRLTRLETEVRSPRIASAQAADALVRLLVIDAARLSWTAPSAKPTQLVAEAAAVIDQRFRDPLSLTDVAATLNVSRSHLTRLVRGATGRSVGEWIRDRRMEEARHLLRDSEEPVDSIAQKVGYRDAAHFRRHFLRAHKSTPARWRERARPDLSSRVR
jgi:AraC-like DNA-binding protein